MKDTSPQAVHLLPCPFCGAQPEITPRLFEQYTVGCSRYACPATYVYTQGFTQQQAIDKWNTRATMLPFPHKL
jgi:hypothetical protein